MRTLLFLYILAKLHTLAWAEGGVPNGLYACNGGVSSFSESFAFANGNKEQKMKIAWSFFVIKSNQSVVLIDSGINDPALAKAWGIQSFKKNTDLLASLQINASAVTAIIITHLHFDHLNGITSFTNAKIYISKIDCENYLARSQHGGVTYTEDIASILKNKDRTERFSGGFRLNDGLSVVEVGGHTHGSSICKVKVNQHEYVLTGDECYSLRNATESRPVGVSASRSKNLAFIQSLSIIDKSLIIPSHEISLYEKANPFSQNIALIEKYVSP